MKKVNEETPERLLIYKDEDLHKYNRKVLDDIFVNTEQMKAEFLLLDVPFNKDTFVKSMNEGTGYLIETLYQRLAENYKGMSEKVIKSLTEGEKGKLKILVAPIEPLIIKIKELLNLISLPVENLSFSDDNSPVISNDLKQYLAELSKRYAVGKDEIEFVHVVEEFIAVANKLEACLAKNSYPLLFTKYFDFQSPMRYAETDSAFFPSCLINYDNVEADGIAQLQLNPNLFEELESNIKSFEDFREHAGLSAEVHGEQNLKIPVASSLRLPRDTARKIEAGISPLPKDRWKGFPGVQKG